MVKKAQIINDKSQLSSPSRPLKRKKTTENARTTAASSQVSATATPSTSSISTKKPDSAKLTPTRFSTRKRRSPVSAESSDSDCTPPPSIVSKSPKKKRILKKRASKNSSIGKGVLAENEVIDLTDSRISSSKNLGKRSKTDKRSPVDLDSFINLCSDEEANPQPLKKRKVIPAEEVIFVSSGDEAEALRGQSVQPTFPSSKHAAEAQILRGEDFVEHTAPDIESTNTTETQHNSLGRTPSPTPPPTSPPENDSSESVAADIAATQIITGIEESPIPKLSQVHLNALYQESLHPPATSSTSEESRSTSFYNTQVSESNQPIRKIVYADKLAKPTLLTSLFFARAIRSVETTRPKANVVLQSPDSVKAAAFIESCPLDEMDPAPLDSQEMILDTLTTTILLPSSTDTLPSANTEPVNISTDKSPEIITLEDICVSPAMEVDETGSEPAFSAQVGTIECSTPDTVVPASGLDESSAEDAPFVQTVAEEHAMLEVCDTSSPAEGQAGQTDPNAEAATTHAEISSAEAESMETSKIQAILSNIILRHCRSVSPGPAVFASQSSPAVEGQVEDTPIQPCDTCEDTLQETALNSTAQADIPLITSPDTKLPSPESSQGPFVDNNDSAIDTPEPEDSPLRDNTSPNPTSQQPPQTFDIDPSVFELEHLPNLTLEILFANKILDDDSDLTISLPCYPEPMYY